MGVQPPRPWCGESGPSTLPGEHDEGGDERAGEGTAVHPQSREAREQGAEGTHRRATGHTQDVGIRQGIAQQHLHQGTGESQESAHGEGVDGARQAQVHDHRVVHGIAAAREGGPEIMQGDGRAAYRQRQEERRPGEQQQEWQP